MLKVVPTIAQIVNIRQWIIIIFFLLFMASSQWIISRVIAKSAVSGEPVFTLMDALLYGP
jgi:hypothetical protein